MLTKGLTFFTLVIIIEFISSSLETRFDIGLNPFISFLFQASIDSLNTCLHCSSLILHMCGFEKNNCEFEAFEMN